MEGALNSDKDGTGERYCIRVIDEERGNAYIHLGDDETVRPTHYLVLHRQMPKTKGGDYRHNV